MIVCVCRRVSDKTIQRLAKSGMGFDDIQWEHGVAAQCGQCESCARSIWQECQQNHAIAHLTNDNGLDASRRATAEV
jgi:bacterioferritin-associated ferredoxin